MMPLIFVILLIAAVFAWRGERNKAKYGFSLTLFTAVIWFYHHVTTALSINL